MSNRRFTISFASLKQKLLKEDASNNNNISEAKERAFADLVNSSTNDSSLPTDPPEATDTPEVSPASPSTNCETEYSAAEFEAIQAQRARELVVEHFGFTPLDLIDNVFNVVNEVIMQALEAFEEFVIDRLGSEDAAEEGSVALQTLMESTIDKYFDKFETYAAKNVFSIPSNLCVTLPHYEGIDDSLIDEDEKEIESRVEALRERLAAAKYYNSTLSTAVTELQSSNASLEKLLAQVKSIAPTPQVPLTQDAQVMALEQDVLVMDQDEQYVNGVLSQIKEKHGSIEFMTQSGKDAKALSENILKYIKRQEAKAPCSGMSGGGDDAAADSSSSSNKTGVSEFLKAIHAGGIATKEEMEEARAIGGPPEWMSRVRGGCGGFGMHQGISFFGRLALSAEGGIKNPCGLSAVAAAAVEGTTDLMAVD
ncbi:Mis12 protein-domain-containing protein [Obelidium mucronatum]|nr:Mis12 protein-domain-containing protein [Obelidium mucronatum]